MIKLLLTTAIVIGSLAVTAMSARYLWQLIHGEWRRWKMSHRVALWMGIQNRKKAS